MIFLVVVPLGVFLAYVILRETFKLAGGIAALLAYLFVIGLAITLVVVLAGLVWQFIVWVFPYVLGGAAVIGIIALIVKAARR